MLHIGAVTRRTAYDDPDLNTALHADDLANGTSVAESGNEELIATKVNTDEQQNLAMHFGIRSLPTVMLFRKPITK